MPIRKTEIDKAPYIVYTGKPDTEYNGSGGGGGGGSDLVLELSYDADLEYYVLDTVITYNEVKAAFDAGKKIYYVQAYEDESGSEQIIGVLCGFNVYEQNGNVYQCGVGFVGPNSANYVFTASSLDEPLSV